VVRALAVHGRCDLTLRTVICAEFAVKNLQDHARARVETKDDNATQSASIPRKVTLSESTRALLASIAQFVRRKQALSPLNPS
jgi:hypothetical protein